MKRLSVFLILLVLSCTTQKSFFKKDNSYTLAFGSCNDQSLSYDNYWRDIMDYKPDYFIWLGDAVYPTEHNLNYLKQAYEIQLNNKDYINFKRKVRISGIWDDHDYGQNDGGVNNPIKKEAQTLFLNFLSVPKTSSLRTQEGIYQSFYQHGKDIKIILLDTRYFRSDLTFSKDTKKRYDPNIYGKGTILGEEQWKWLENEIKNSEAKINVIFSGYQVLNDFHSYEKWGNMPHEKERLEKLLNSSHQRNIIISGGRHFAEISQKGNLVDFTSSGLNKSYSGNFEENPLRVSKFVKDTNYGVIKFDFFKHYLTIEIIGKNKQVYDSLKLDFK